jgi:hypothetical protein
MKARVVTGLFALASMALIAVSGAAPFQNW